MRNQVQAKSNMQSCIASGSHTRTKVARFVKRAVSKIGRRDWKLDVTQTLDANFSDAKLDKEDELDALYDGYLFDICDAFSEDDYDDEYEYRYLDQLWDDATRAETDGLMDWHDSLMKQYYEGYDKFKADKKANKDKLSAMLLPSPMLTTPLMAA